MSFLLLGAVLSQLIISLLLLILRWDFFFFKTPHVFFTDCWLHLLCFFSTAFYLFLLLYNVLYKFVWQTVIQFLHFNHKFHYIQNAELCPITFRWYAPLLCSLCFSGEATFENQWSHHREPRGGSHASLLPALPPDATFTCSICGSMSAHNGHLQCCHRWQAQLEVDPSILNFSSIIFVC